MKWHSIDDTTEYDSHSPWTEVTYSEWAGSEIMRFYSA